MTFRWTCIGDAFTFQMLTDCRALSDGILSNIQMATQCCALFRWRLRGLEGAMHWKFSSRLLCTGFQIYVQIIEEFHTKCNIGSPVVVLRAVDVPQGESSGSDVPRDVAVLLVSKSRVCKDGQLTNSICTQQNNWMRSTSYSVVPFIIVLAAE
jgi:hypothetical protein